MLDKKEYKLAAGFEYTDILKTEDDQYKDCAGMWQSPSTKDAKFMIEFFSPENDKGTKLIEGQFEGVKFFNQNKLSVQFGGFLAPVLGNAQLQGEFSNESISII